MTGSISRDEAHRRLSARSRLLTKAIDHPDYFSQDPEARALYQRRLNRAHKLHRTASRAYDRACVRERDSR